MSTDQGWMTPFTDNLTPENTRGKLIILFRAVPTYMKAASEKADHAIYEERIHITKIVPGDRGLVVDRPVNFKDKQEFPIEWARWEQTRQNAMSGTPIDRWQILTDTQKMEFKANNVHTVEQLASLDDGRLQSFRSGLDLRAKARAFVNSAKTEADVEAANAKVKALEDQLAKLTAMVEGLTAPTPKVSEKVHA